MAHAVERGIAVRAASDVQVLQGKGVTGIVDGEPFWLGSHRYVIERGQDSPEASRQAEALEQEGKTVVAIGNDRHLCGQIGRHTSELQSLMRISYAVFCLKKKNAQTHTHCICTELIK